MAPKEYKTLAEAVEGLKQRGFAANFELLNKTFQLKGGYKLVTISADGFK